MSAISSPFPIFARIDQSAANVFIDRLLDGTGLSQSNPIHTLRERLLSDPKMRTVDRYEAIVRAWNAMRKGRTLDKIQIMGRAPKVEA